MTFSSTHPLRYVCVAKIAESDVPAAHAGDLRSYYFGQLNPGVSFPVKYSVEGWLICLPEMGVPVYVLRTNRNGVMMPGIFITTPVTAVPNDGEFHTANSKYIWKIAVPEFTWPPAANAYFAHPGKPTIHHEISASDSPAEGKGPPLPASNPKQTS